MNSYFIADIPNNLQNTINNFTDVSDKILIVYNNTKEIDNLMDSEKKLFPNVDFYGGLLLYELGFDIDLFTPIFVAGRIAGWSAHYFEQHDQDILIRPAAKYIGPSER